MGRKMVYRVDVDRLGGRCQSGQLHVLDHTQTQF
jgi:hypothetical protein